MTATLASLELRPTLLDQVGTSQKEDPQIVEIMDKLIGGETSSHLGRYAIDDKGWLRRDERLCVPQVGDLVRKVLEEAHHSKMTIHPREDKMYREMKHIILLAWNEKGRGRVRFEVHGVPTSKGRVEEAWWAITSFGGSAMEMGEYLDGFRGWTA